jgi:tryptophanyl-tRNA synthetase
VAHFESAYNQCTIRYGDMKKQLAEDMIRFISPVREKSESIRTDQKYLQRVMEMGAEKARASARETMRLAREVMGLRYY